MSRADAKILDTNDLFPNLELQTISGETLSLPTCTGDDYAVVLFYRGHW